MHCSLHCKPDMGIVLQVQQQQVQGKENAGQRPWHVAAAQSEADFLAGISTERQ